MVSTNQVTNDNSQVLITISIPVNKPSAIKFLRKYYELLDVKPETAVCRLGAAKSKCKYIITGSMLRSSIPNRHGRKKK